MLRKSTQRYREVLLQAIRDGDLTQIERAELSRIYRLDGLKPEDVQRANREVLESLVNEMIQDRALDDLEQSVLARAAHILGLPLDSLPQGLLAQLGHAARIHQILSGSPLPAVDPSSLPVRISHAEPVYLATPVAIIEERVVARNFQSGSSGIRFRVAKGVSVNFGGSRGRSVPVKAPVRISDGPLLLTATHVRFFGERKGFQKPWKQVAGVEPFSDAITVFFANRATGTTLWYDDPTVATAVEALFHRMLNQP